MSNGAEVDTCAIPEGAPPPGQSSNFVDPHTLAPAIIAISAIVMAWSILFVVGRFVAGRRVGRLTLSDYYAAIGLVFALIQGSLVLSKLEYARHAWDIPACWYQGDFGSSYAKFVYADAIMCCLGMLFSKASILTLFYHLFEINKNMKRLIQASLITCYVVYIAVTILMVYWNAPEIGETWAGYLSSSKAATVKYIDIGQSTVNVTFDVYIFILPLPILARLQLSMKKRLQLLAVFSTALIGVAASAVSLACRVLSIQHPSDKSWYTASIFLSIHVELCISIIVSSVPGFAKFVREYVAEWAPVKVLRSRFSSHSSQQLMVPGDSGNTPRMVAEEKARKLNYVHGDDSWALRSDETTDNVLIIQKC